MRVLPPYATCGAGRGLAFEGLSAWPEALNDYDRALALAEAAGLLPDPYILNSRGNCHASLGKGHAAVRGLAGVRRLLGAAAGPARGPGSPAPRRCC